MMTDLLQFVRDSVQVESKKSVRQAYLDTNRITQEEFDRILSWDPTEKKKYSDWLAKQFVAGVDPVELEHGIQDFHQGVEKNLIKNKDINSYSMEEFNRVLGDIEGVKTGGETEEEVKKGADKVWEDDSYLVVSPQTREASIYYGKGTKWCTSATKSKNYFDNYRYLGHVNLYYIINKKTQEKWAVAVKMNNTRTIYDQQDKKVKVIPEGVPGDIFKPLLLKDVVKDVTRQGTKNSDGSYSFKGNVSISNLKLNSLSDLGIVIKEVGGNFHCTNNKLTSLRGAPEKVGRDFYCNDNKLTTLEGAPEKVGRDFYFYNNKLTSLRYAPREVGGQFDCSDNRLTTLDYAPERVGGSFNCGGNRLITLEGAPKKVGGGFACHRNKLVTLKGAPREVSKHFYCTDNELTSLQGAPEKVGGSFDCNDNQLTSLRGAPREVGGNFHCYNNPLKSLEGKPKHIGGRFRGPIDKKLSKKKRKRNE